MVTVRIRQDRVHQPELDILDVGFLEVGVIQSPHDTCPAFLGTRHLTVRSHFTRIDVVLSAFRGVVSQVQDRQFGIYVAGFLTIRIDLVLINDTGAVITECGQVILDVCRRVRLRITEDRIYGEPSKMCTVLVVGHSVDVLRFIKDDRRRGQEPITRIVYVNIRRGALEIIDISRTHRSDIVCVTRNKVCEFRANLEGGWSSCGDPRNLVYRVR